MGLESLVIAYTSHVRSLAHSLARELGAELVDVVEKSFPDGEAYVRLTGGGSGRVAIALFTGFPDPPRRLVEGLLLIEALRGAYTSGVIAFPAYLPFSRQDRRFLKGEPISVRAVLSSIASVGADALLTIDVHKEYSLEWFPGPSKSVDPSRAFADAIASSIQGDYYVIAPDHGALKRAQKLAEKLGAPFTYLEKHRDRVTGEVTLKTPAVDVRDATIILVDDIASTAGTLAKAASMLLNHGAKRVVAAVTHCLLVGSAVERLEGAGVERLYCANTVTPAVDWSRIVVVDVGREAAKSVSELVQRLYGYES